MSRSAGYPQQTYVVGKRWRMRLTFGVVDDRPAVIGFEIYSVDPRKLPKHTETWPDDLPTFTSPLNAIGIRVPLGRYLQEFAQERLAKAEYVEPPDRVEGPRIRKPSRGRPVMHGREHYGRVAGIYTTALAAGAHNPRHAVAKLMGTNDSTAAKWIARCRQLDLLPPTSAGRAAGYVPEHAKGKPRQALRGSKAEAPSLREPIASHG